MNRIIPILLMLVCFFTGSAQAQGVHNSTVIVLDGSGSMDENMRDDRTGAVVKKMTAAKSALKSVLRQVPADTHVGLLVFVDGRNYWAYELGALNITQMEEAIDKIHHDGGTPLGAAIKIGTDALVADRKVQHGVGSYQLLVVTDGQATDEGAMEHYAPLVPQWGIRMDVIGVAMPGGQDHELAKFAQSYQAADDTVKLQTALEKLVRVEAGGDNATIDFTATDGVPLEVARVWLGQLSAPAPDYPLGEQPPEPVQEGRTESPKTQAASPPSADCNSAGSSLAGSVSILLAMLFTFTTRRHPRLIPVPVRR